MSIDFEEIVRRQRQLAAEQRAKREAEAAARQADPEWQREHRARVLAYIGFGPRYQYPDPGRIPPELRRGVEEYLAGLHDYVRQGQGLWLAGPVGVGKTCALAWLCAHVALAGYSVEYRDAPPCSTSLHGLTAKSFGPYGPATCSPLTTSAQSLTQTGRWRGSRSLSNTGTPT